MNSRAWAFIWVLLFFLVENAVGIALPQIHLPLLLIVVLYYALGEGPVFGMTLGAFAGFLLDLLGVGKMGMQTGLLGLVGWCVGFLSTNLFRESPLTQVLLPGVVALILQWMNTGFVRFTFHESQGPLNWDWLAAAVSSPFIFSLLKKVQNPRR